VFFRCLQEVHLDKHIKLLDCPGIVMATSTSDAAMILRNCVKIEQLVDPIPPVEAILRRCNKIQVCNLYFKNFRLIECGIIVFHLIESQLVFNLSCIDNGSLWNSRLPDSTWLSGLTCPSSRQAEERRASWLRQSCQECSYGLDRVRSQSRWI